MKIFQLENKEILKMEKTTFEKMNDARDVILKELLGM